MAYLEDLYLLDAANKKLHKFAKDALVTDGYPLPVGSQPYNVCVCTNTHDVWVTNQGDNTVMKFSDGEYILSVDVKAKPRGICEGRNGEIYVACWGTNYICKIYKDAESNSYKVKPISVGRAPTALCVNHNGELYVTLYTSKKIVKIVNDTVVATLNTGLYPSSICCDKADNIWVACTLSNTVCKFMKDVENPVATIKVDKYPVAICCGYNGSIYVACKNDDTVCRIDGIRLVKKYVTGNAPTSIASTADKIYVLCDGDAGSTINYIDKNTGSDKADTVIESLKNGEDEINVRVVGGDFTGYQAYLILKKGSSSGGGGFSGKIGFDDLTDSLKEMIQAGSSGATTPVTLPIADKDVTHPNATYKTVFAAIEYLLNKPEPIKEVNSMKGGHHTAMTLDDMYSIPKDLRIEGMECYVVSESKCYTLLLDDGNTKMDPSCWTEASVSPTAVVYADGENVADKLDKVDKKASTKYLYFVLSPVDVESYDVELVVPFDGELVKVITNTDSGKTLTSDLELNIESYDEVGGTWDPIDRETIEAGSATNMTENDLSAAPISINKNTKLRVSTTSVDLTAGLNSLQVVLAINQTV